MFSLLDDNEKGFCGQWHMWLSASVTLLSTCQLIKSFFSELTSELLWQISKFTAR